MTLVQELSELLSVLLREDEPVAAVPVAPAKEPILELCWDSCCKSLVLSGHLQAVCAQCLSLFVAAFASTAVAVREGRVRGN